MTKVLDQSIGLEDKRARLLAAVLKKKHIERPQAMPIPRRSVHSPCVLSFAQQRLWLLDQLSPGSAAYNIPLNIRLSGHLNEAVIELTMNKIVQRHEVLRTRFEEFEGEPRQVIAGSSEVLLEKADLSKWQGEEQQKEVRERALQEAQIPFDLARGPLLRVKLLRLGEAAHVLLVTMHHIVSDGWSLGIMMREFEAFYRAYSEGEGAPLPELELQYADYAVWQREWLEGGELQEQMGYWKEQLAGLEKLELPTDHPRPAVMSHRGATVGMELEEELTTRLWELCRREKVTLFMALLAGVQVLLGRYAGQQEVAVGTPIANRMRQEVEPLIGFFVNTLVLRGEVRSEWSFQEMLKRVREVTLAAYAHQDVPFEQLVEELQPVRDLSRNPLFEVMLIVQNTPQESFSLPGLSVEGLNTEEEVAKFDLMFAAVESAGKIRVGINYATELYERATIERMAGHFRAVVEQMTRNADSRIGEVSILSEAERAELEGWNRTAVEYPQRCVHELFEEQAARTPKAIALEYEGQTLTYGELNRRANQLGHYLRKLGVGPEVRVGICVERSLEMVIGLLGILKAGGAYVPLDPDYPPERLQFMAEDAQVAVLLTEKKFRDLLWTSGASEICLDERWGEIAQESKAEVGVHLGPRYLAYVIFTSGSTGRPKGVGVEHRSIVRLVKGTNYVEVKEEDVFLQMAPVSFDAATFEIWGSLLNGCRLVVYPAGIPSLEELGVVVEKSGVTVLWLTAGLFHQMVDTEVKRLQGVRQLLAGGDVLSTAHVRRVLAELGETCLINGYGPTENTTFSCCHRMSGEAGSELWGTVPIGRPITNSQAYVLDEEMRYEPMPVGIAGELYVGGEGLARGYMNRPELTAEKFVPNPFSEREGERLYRTGDRVRWRGDGSLEFAGRLDHQVKLRGYRIELGEIEALLRGMAGVKDAAVVMREEAEGDKRLVAYVVGNWLPSGPGAYELPNEMDGVSEERLWAQLQQRLPGYMVPAYFVRLQSMPLSSNGKIDRAALHDITPEIPSGEAKFLAPRDKVEEKLKRIWIELLGFTDVGVKNNFFQVGGHSLTAIMLANRITKDFNKKATARLIFARPTIEQQAVFLRGEVLGADPAHRSLVPIQPEGNLRPLFCVHPFFGLAYCYKELSSLLGNNQPFYGLQSSGLEEGESVLKTIPEMAASYMKAITVIQSSGPYQLAGWSMGALVAYEMAQQLLAAGQQVSFLGLMEGHNIEPTQPPSSVLAPEEWKRRVIEQEEEMVVDLMKHELGFTDDQLSGMSHEERSLEYLANTSNTLFRNMTVPQAQRLLRVATINQLAVEVYRPQPYPGTATLFRIPLKPGEDASCGWSRVVEGELTIFEIPGTHHGFMSGISVALIAAQLKSLVMPWKPIIIG